MTAGEIVTNACKQAGLVEDGTTTSIVSTLGIGSLSIGGGLTAEAGTVPATAAEIGLAILNRWYLYAWQRFPHRDIKIANAVVTVAAGAVAVDLPTEMDVIRSVRIAGGALLPLSEVREADFAAISGPTCWSEGYMNGQTIYTCSYGLAHFGERQQRAARDAHRADDVHLGRQIHGHGTRSNRDIRIRDLDIAVRIALPRVEVPAVENGKADLGGSGRDSAGRRREPAADRQRADPQRRDDGGRCPVLDKPGLLAGVRNDFPGSHGCFLRNPPPARDKRETRDGRRGYP